MSEFYNIGDKDLSINDISKIIREEIKIKLSKNAESKVVECRMFFYNYSFEKFS